MAAASIVLLDGDLPTPVGASSTSAVAAERWQFTIGTGPATDPGAVGGPQLLTQITLATQWPALHRVLLRHTPYKAMAVLPLGRWSGNIGMLTLYLHQPTPGPDFHLHTAEIISALTYTHLLNAVIDETTTQHPSTRDTTVEATTTTPTPAEPDRGYGPVALLPPPWFQSPIARQHQDVWVAVGMIISTHHCDTPHALSLLRAYALRADVTADVLAAALIAGRVPTQDLKG